MTSAYAGSELSPQSYEDYPWIAKDYSSIVFLTLCLYDHVITFDLEVELVWGKKMSLVQALYFTNRYVGNCIFVYDAVLLLWLPDNQFNKLCVYITSYIYLSRCPSLDAVKSWMSMVSVTAYQGIVAHRIYSMCCRRRTVLITTLVALGILVMTSIAVGTIWTIGLRGVPRHYGPTLRTCVASGWSPWSVALWYILLAFDLLVFGLAVTEGIRYLRDRPKARAASEGSVGTQGVDSQPLGGSIITKIFLRDSILFPFIGLFLCLSNILAWHVLPFGVMQYTISIAALMSPVLGSRLILSLRDAYYRPFAEEVELIDLWS